ncbi:unnamed protein product [Vitrella brassicaformis CCMP3155]|uniref:Uncharacterized protein n=4 Tax=Vitrella brassicaformis TaxID=1169539 RepID=A0A0G4GJA9_VITBC|nr:unnamed protein product [Vitrella brassicaformis CCMP3155]|eukprot:CEM29934.1 unnamed protein product [Vitrella brassicaformis CCMP3155]
MGDIGSHGQATAVKQEGERLPVIEFLSPIELGRHLALRFLAFAKSKPRGVIALPTGKTPEMFIKFLTLYRDEWGSKAVEEDFRQGGLASLMGGPFPDTSELTFVQLDEFFPILPSHKNAFTHYVRERYMPLLGIPESRFIHMDLIAAGVITANDIHDLFPDGKADISLLSRDPVSEVEKERAAALKRVAEFCQKFDERVRSLGGIDFFLGGIGPDGHIAFNMPGSGHDSTTRLVRLNYPTAAQAAVDLGGIEYARDKLAMTLGLGTICSKRDSIIIIAAVGEGKAKVVRDALLSHVSEDVPATAFHSHTGCVLYVSRGAVKELPNRRAIHLQRQLDDCASCGESVDSVRDRVIDEGFINTALQQRCSIESLRQEHLQSTPTGRLALRTVDACGPLSAPSSAWPPSEESSRRLMSKLDRGLATLKGIPAFRSSYRGKRGDEMVGGVGAEEVVFLHTAPHHDDIMLSYHPLMKVFLSLPNYHHHFAYLTSGFHSVSDSYMLSTLARAFNCDGGVDRFIANASALIFRAPYDEVLQRFTAAQQRKDNDTMGHIETVLMLRQVVAIWDATDAAALAQVARRLHEKVLPSHMPGDALSRELQLLKGGMRETEVDRMWALRGVSSDRTRHLRSKFYTDDYFTPLPTLDDDAMPLAKLIQECNPEVITVALDPEGTGPDTHYKVLQVVAEAVRYVSAERASRGVSWSPSIWGYRNVWHRFDMWDANLIFPTDQQLLHEMNDAFLSCFSTQKAASFPSPYYDGPFSKWGEAIQREQLADLKTLLGPSYATNHPDALVSGASGCILLKEMTAQEFLREARELKDRLLTYHNNRS